LVASFPNFNQPYCAWVALVPWLLALRDMTPRQTIRWSYLVGLAFFLGSIWWLVHVTVVGLIVLCAYLALYFGVFGWLTHLALGSRCKVQGSRGRSLSLVPCPLSVFVVPAAWVSLEFLRSHLFTGFGWNLLGYSQTPALAAIQLADLTGVWGVSFVIVLMNVAIAQYVRAREVRRVVPAMLLALVCVTASWGYGQWRLRQPETGARLTIAVVQGNIPQQEKWDAAFQQEILERYARLTQEAARRKPQLIIWPETSVPGFVEVDETLATRVQALARSAGVPLVVGAPMIHPTVPAPQRGRRAGEVAPFTNSTLLLDSTGTFVARYDKLHLVPFGEFVPFEDVMPWLRTTLPPIGDFVPGHEHTVFHLDGSMPQATSRRSEEKESLEPAAWSPQPFSVLICFEDIFPNLARQFVRRGARLLATITNDAWFGNTAAAYQHAQASTLRAVELRVPMVRAANTGWSGCIDAKGRWVASVRDPRGQELFVEGVAVCEVAVASNPDSVYRRYGDWFAWLCLLVVAGWAIFAIMKHR